MWAMQADAEAHLETDILLMRLFWVKCPSREGRRSSNSNFN